MTKHFQSGRICELPSPATANSTATSTSTGSNFRAGRIVYVHGAGYQPAPSELKRLWDVALFENEIGDRSRMAYWGERTENPAASGVERTYGPRPTWQMVLDETLEAAADESQRQFVRQLAGDLGINLTKEAIAGSVRQFRAVVQDSLKYFFDGAFRERVQRAVSERLPSDTPLVLVTHGLGSLICFDVLSQATSRSWNVRLWVTLGSPHEIPVIAAKLNRGGNDAARAAPAGVARWLQVADEADRLAAAPVAARLAAARRARVESLHGRQINQDASDPHSFTGYLQNPEVRRRIRDVVGDEIGQATSRFLIAKDLVNAIEDEPEERHHVLIQLTDVDRTGDLEQNSRKVQDELVRILGERRGDANIEVLRRFVAADLTRWEIEAVSQAFESLRIARLWRDSEKASLIDRSSHTLQARAAVVGYGATGRGIRWAVLDTGVAGDHPHFREFGNVRTQWDCTQPLASPRIPAQIQDTKQNTDKNGHGTHVAGIIAGQMRLAAKGKGDSGERLLAAMAPECGLDSYKVLDDYGRGRDSWIIKALDHIAEVNDRAGRLEIHGVNLSLGGPFDPSVYGCGHSPLCQELRRLWRQGVLVCVAVGNEGLAELQTTRGTMRANQDVTIIDPANLEECIAVGSVHKEHPHTYGVSYFSSRGPTADGRVKPDVVAPGERILSANSRFDPADENGWYIERSGTSMAAPHVSGLLAAFLSVKREFIGQPDRVKEILAENCTNLGRDRCFQGHGLPNLVKMLVQT